MRPRLFDEARARAEAMFNQRHQRKVDAPMAEYRAAQAAALERMRELRRLRLAGEENRIRQAAEGAAKLVTKR